MRGGFEGGESRGGLGKCEMWSGAKCGGFVDLQWRGFSGGVAAGRDFARVFLWLLGAWRNLQRFLGVAEQPP